MGELTAGQYRALVAYLSFWPKVTRDHAFGLELAMQDIGITLDRDTVIGELWKCGWVYEEVDGDPRLRWEEGEE